MSDPLSEITAEELTARVLAWQHRHPLARRLRAADVQSIGHVAVPFVDPAAPPPEPAGGSLRERALARANASAAPSEPAPGAGPAADRPLRAAFDEDLLTPLAPAAVAAWALAHGVQRPREPLGLPVRRLPVRPGTPGVSWRWLLTAELRDGTARTRVLLGPAAGAPVLGRRLWSPVRLGLLAGLCGALLASTVVLLLRPAASGPAGMPDMASAAGPAPGAPAASAPAPTAPVAALATAASAAASDAAAPQPAPPAPASSAPLASAQASPGPAISPPSPAPAPASASPVPLDVEPRQGRIELPSLGPRIEERRRRAAEQQAAAASAAASAAAPAPRTPPTVAAAVAGSPAFALGTRLLRTRTESQQIAEALRSLLVVPGSPVLEVEVLPVGDDFRVVAWPYPGREAAERAAAGLAARGHRVQVIEF